MFSAVSSVSYTHLDVYKRQVRKVRDWLVAEFAGLEASREALGLIAVHCDLSLPVTSE